DVLLLLQQPRPTVRQQRKELRELGALVAGDFVEIQQLADLGQREPETLAAQDELDADALAIAVNTSAAVAARRDQSAILVEADRARGQREFARKVGDRVGGGAAGRSRSGGTEGSGHWRTGRLRHVAISRAVRDRA